MKQMSKKLGVMDPCMWMIFQGSNSGQLHTLVANTFVKNTTDWHYSQRPETQ